MEHLAEAAFYTKGRRINCPPAVDFLKRFQVTNKTTAAGLAFFEDYAAGDLNNTDEEVEAVDEVIGDGEDDDDSVNENDDIARDGEIDEEIAELLNEEFTLNDIFEESKIEQEQDPEFLKAPAKLMTKREYIRFPKVTIAVRLFS